MPRHRNHPESLLASIYEHHVAVGIVATRTSGVMVTAWAPALDGSEPAGREVGFAKSDSLTCALRSVLAQLAMRAGGA